MSRDEMIEALGTIARSGTKASWSGSRPPQGADAAQQGGRQALIGRFGVGSIPPSWWLNGSR